MALAKRALGDERGAKGMFNRLISYGMEHMDDKAEFDYFAVSLPDFLVFDTDMNRKNRVTCSYLAALGFYGLGDSENAVAYADKGLGEDVSHQGLIELKKIMKRGI